jgi:hypothetical protein
VTNNGGGTAFDASGNKYGGFSVNNATVAFNSSFTNALGATFSGINSTVTIVGNVTNQGQWFIDPSTFIFNGNFTNSGTLTTSGGDTFEFLGAGTHYLNLGTAGLTLGNLILGAGVTLDVTGSGTLDVTNFIEGTGATLVSTADSSGIKPDFIPKNTSTVPIPGGLILLAPGLLALVGIRRRFKVSTTQS